MLQSLLPQDDVPLELLPKTGLPQAVIVEKWRVHHGFLQTAYVTKTLKREWLDSGFVVATVDDNFPMLRALREKKLLQVLITPKAFLMNGIEELFEIARLSTWLQQWVYIAKGNSSWITVRTPECRPIWIRSPIVRLSSKKCGIQAHLAELLQDRLCQVTCFRRFTCTKEIKS